MIQLYVLDIDGCITYPFETPPWDVLTQVRDLQRQSLTNEPIPSLALCTGRPYPYTEAVAQYLDIRYPVIFERGGGLYEPVHSSIEISPHFDDDALREKREISRFVEEEVLPHYSTAYLEFAKYTDVGIVGNEKQDIIQMYEKIKEWVGEHYTDVEVHHTDVSVNVIRKACNKAEGLKQLSQNTGIPLEQMAYIGDSSGDIKAMREAGVTLAPANATPEVKSTADYTMKGEITHAVLEGYHLLMELNHKELAEQRV